jgi:hypothetical protein
LLLYSKRCKILVYVKKRVFFASQKMHPKQQQMLAWELSLTCRQGAMVQHIACGSGRWAAAAAAAGDGGNRNSSRRQPSRRAPSPAEPASMWVTGWHLDSCCQRPKFPGLPLPAAVWSIHAVLHTGLPHCSITNCIYISRKLLYSPSAHLFLIRSIKTVISLIVSRKCKQEILLLLSFYRK